MSNGIGKAMKWIREKGVGSSPIDLKLQAIVRWFDEQNILTKQNWSLKTNTYDEKSTDYIFDVRPIEFYR